MNPTTQLDRLGQRLWLDNITRDLLVSGTLQRYIRDFAISGSTSIRPSSIKGSVIPTCMTKPFARGQPTDARAKHCSWISHWRM